MADDGYGNFGNLLQDCIGFVVVEVPEDDDEVGLVMKLDGVLLRCFDDGKDMPGTHFIGGSESVDEGAKPETDDGGAEASHSFGDVGASREGGTPFFFRVGGE